MRLLQRIQKTEVEQLTRSYIDQLPSEQLLGWHYRLHQLWGTHADSGGTAAFEYVQPHSNVVDTMAKRGYKHLMVDELDQSSGRVVKASESLSQFGQAGSSIFEFLAKTRGLQPFDEFLPPKPKHAIYDPRSSQLEDWFKAQTNKQTRTVEVFVEPKYNGLRVILHHADGKLAVIYQDSSTDHSGDVLGADARLKSWHNLPDCVLDGDLCVVQGGKRWSRAQMMTFLTDHPQLPDGATLQYTAYDLLVWQEVAWNIAPFWRRLKALTQIAPELAKFAINVAPAQLVGDVATIQKLFTDSKFGAADQCEGIILKAGDWIYGVGGRDTAGMLKLKKSLVVSALVLHVQKNQDGTFRLSCGVPAGQFAGKLDNLIAVQGVPYVQLGAAHNAAFQATPGEWVDVRIEELVYRADPPSLTWTGPTPVSIDQKGAAESAESLISRAQQAGIYQETGQNIAKSETKCRYPDCENPAIYRLLWADGRAVTYACADHRDAQMKTLTSQGEDETSIRESVIKHYVLMKSDESQHYTLGVAYPAEEIDSHGDFASLDDVEKAAWNYLVKSREVGLMHKSGTDGAGIVVESYIYRGPNWNVEDQVVRTGDWLLGVVWDDAAWADIQAGKVQGYSIQGLSRREE